MKHKELRLALVCYGGISLAVYMHGVTREFLKLARASRAYHAEPDVAARAGLAYADRGAAGDGAISTEAVYFDLLKTIGDRLDLRVVIDVVAGASAGGINGVVLARALAHDLALEPLRDWWLREADVTRLLTRKGRARAWSKWFLRPAIWILTRRRIDLVAPTPEIRRKLSIFLRSRWFRPPFDGARLAGVLFDAIEEMSGAEGEAGSLVPDGLNLDLFVTVTDFYGYGRVLRGHDPPLIMDREHRHVLHFAYRRPRGGETVSTLDRP
ncbi:MAG: patatin-like phospholipase family protein, partial [Alphaproteobacteria bacterium]